MPHLHVLTREQLQQLMDFVTTSRPETGQAAILAASTLQQAPELPEHLVSQFQQHQLAGLASKTGSGAPPPDAAPLEE